MEVENGICDNIGSEKIGVFVFICIICYEVVRDQAGWKILVV